MIGELVEIREITTEYLRSELSELKALQRRIQTLYMRAQEIRVDGGSFIEDNSEDVRELAANFNQRHGELSASLMPADREAAQITFRVWKNGPRLAVGEKRRKGDLAVLPVHLPVSRQGVVIDFDSELRFTIQNSRGRISQIDPFAQNGEFCANFEVESK